MSGLLLITAADPAKIFSLLSIGDEVGRKSLLVVVSLCHNNCSPLQAMAIFASRNDGKKLFGQRHNVKRNQDADYIILQ